MSTYYRPFLNKINVTAGGKLYEQYVSYRKILGSRGVIQLRNRKNNAPLHVVHNLDAFVDESFMNVLKTNIDVENESLIRAWEMSFNFRQSLKISDLMDLAVSLKEPFGYKLVINRNNKII